VRVIDTHVPAAEYDATVDECVDTSLRAFRRTATHARTRLRSRLFVGGCFALGMFFTILQESGDSFAIDIVLPLTLVAGAIVAAVYGPVHNHLHVRQMRRFFLERFKGAPTLHCRVELRPDGLWARSADMDVSIPWQRVTGIVEASAGVELWTDPMGLCLVPLRAFATTADYRAFVDAATRLKHDRRIHSA
jgi:hypothetical protein